MARDFSKNTSNKVSLGVGTLGPLFDQGRVLTAHAWVNFDTLTTGATDNRIFGALFGGNLTLFTMYVDGSVTPKNFTVGGRALSTDTFQSRSHKAPIMLNTWYSVAGVVDYERKLLSVYVNGQRGGLVLAATLGATVATDNATGRTGSDGLGCNDATSVTTAVQCDGRIAELTMWKNARLSEIDFARLAAGWPSHLIRRGNQVVRYPLSDAGIIDVVAGKNGTISGSVPLVPYEPFRYSSIRPYIPFFDAAAVSTRRRIFAVT